MQQGHGFVTASESPAHLAGDLAIFDFALSAAEMEQLDSVGMESALVV